VRRLAFTTLTTFAVLTVSCTGDDPNPVGTDLLSDGILGGGVESLVVTNFLVAEDAEVFPADRAQADRLPIALEWPRDPGFESRGLFRVSTSRIDSLQGAEISEVSMRLVFERVERPVTVRVHRVTSAWSEQAVTWDRRELGQPWATPGGDLDPVPVSEFVVEPTPADGGANGDDGEDDGDGEDDAVDDGTSNAAGDSIQVPLPPELLEGWIDGTIPNHGLALVLATPGERIDFVSAGLGGLNPNGPRIDVIVLLGGVATEAFLQAEEDGFIVRDDDPFDPGGLVVNGAEPVRRVFLSPAIDEIPEGAAVASARLVVTVRDASVPTDSLLVVGRQVLSDFLGENTVLGPVQSASIVGLATVLPGTQPGDSLVFESTLLTSLVRLWVREPERTRGIGLTLFEEERVFGGVSLFGPDAPPDRRPRLRILFIPPSESLAPTVVGP